MKKHDVFVTVSQDRGEGKSPYTLKLSANSKELKLHLKDKSKGLKILADGIAGQLFMMANAKIKGNKFIAKGKPVQVIIESPVLNLDSATVELNVDLQVSKQKMALEFSKALLFLIQSTTFTFGDYVGMASSDEFNQQPAKNVKPKAKRKSKAKPKAKKEAPQPKAENGEALV